MFKTAKQKCTLKFVFILFAVASFFSSHCLLLFLLLTGFCSGDESISNSLTTSVDQLKLVQKGTKMELLYRTCISQGNSFYRAISGGQQLDTLTGYFFGNCNCKFVTFLQN